LIVVAQIEPILKHDHRGRTIMRSTHGKPWQSVVVIVVVVVGLLGSATLSFAQARGNPNPGVFPITSRPFGKTYGQWSARWWQWALSIPADRNPALDETGAHCAEGQAGRVWFLAGSFFGGTFVRACAVPPGKALFFAVVNAAFGAAVGDCEPTNPGVPCDVPTLREAAEESMDPVTIEASIDGVPLRNLNDYRVQSPVFRVTLPEGNVPELIGLPAPSGTYKPMVSDGYWLMHTPLSAGAHTIHFKSIITGGPFVGTNTEVTYHLTVGR
jgi:hypothetical protein